MKVFTNARVILPDGMIDNGFLLEQYGKIMQIGPMEAIPEYNAPEINCEGMYLSPGFVDIHTHGGGGYDYMDGTLQDVVCSARAHLAHGTTSLLPTTLTSSDEALYTTIDSYMEAKKITDNMPNLLGLHLEGPYFSLEEKGAQDPRFLQNPTPEHYLKIIEYAQGNIRRISFAPELPGALEMADRLAGTGILLSAGHTTATHEQMKTAFAHGVRHLTHFYSGMSTITRRQGMRVLGVVESGYLLDGLCIEIIADGIHLPPDLLKLILRCKNHDEICLCTDSMRAAGAGEGPSILGARNGGQPVIVEGGIAKMPDRTCFAGSVATTDRLVRVMVKEAGLPMWEAVKMMTLNPARFIHADDTKGSLQAGKDADLVLFDDAVTVHSVYIKGCKADV